MPNLNNPTILIAILAVTGAAVVLQTLILFALALTARKTARTLDKLGGEVHRLASEVCDSALPTLKTTRDFLERSRVVLDSIAPNIESGAKDFAEIACKVRAQTDTAQSTITEIVDRVRSQAERLDHQLTSALDAVDRASEYVNQAVVGPMRQLSNLLAGVRAGMNSLRGGPR